MRTFDTPPFMVFCLMLLLGIWLNGDTAGVEAKRGPHHPRGEIDRERRGKVDEHFAHDTEHMQHDLADNPELVHDKDVSNMTEEEKNFYYFKLHDLDNNDGLDGLELIWAATHHAEHAEHEKTDHDAQTIAEEMNHILDIIDDLITYGDYNHDGFLSYAEYLTAITRAEETSELNANLDGQLIT